MVQTRSQNKQKTTEDAVAKLKNEVDGNVLRAVFILFVFYTTHNEAHCT